MLAYARASSDVLAIFLFFASTCPLMARDNMVVGAVRSKQAARPAAPSALSDGIAQQLLDAHNAERARLGLKPLAWSDRLAAAARDWAEQLARMDNLEHSEDSDRDNMGENLWMGTKGDFTPKEMVGGFIDERRDFTPGTFPDVSLTGDWADVGHYTQLIWPDTRQVGCAVADNGESEVLVCRYYPAGNVEGEAVP